MREIHLAGIGGGLILASFAIIVSFFVFQGVEEQVIVENGAPGFSQLAAIRDSAKMYVMHILADGTAEGDSNKTPPEDFVVGPLAQTVLQVCPTSGCPT